MIKKMLAWFSILLFAIFSIYPVLYVLSVSLRGDNAFQSQSLEIITSTSTVKNFIDLFTATNFLLWLRNSLFISFVTTLLGVTFASTSAYALSRYRFRGRNLMLFSLLATQMFPPTMLILPFYIILSKMELIDSFWGLFIIYSSTALPFCVWQMKAYYDTIPKELEEAALLDGCSRWKTFYKIILPVSSPALVITALFSFLASWSEYVIAAVVLQDPQLYTLPLGLRSFQASLATQWGLYAAGALIVSVPVLVLFISISRYLVSGLTIGSVKG
ncbi:sugar ABC transporter permease [Bdellovibrio reynosensis]|uniref:Maltose/maltodextrin transport system permease protein MalG n=1 Tax=Bdellovibrio reynosensis TaxID=2835041 RepID=A0ABY4C6X3_9BACT|nr:ABC transporter permease subunit [Bdellovibrio reynosensis]UOF00665.1 ABC transporter permease subunit [Bdellovibrio reynosensis]